MKIDNLKAMLELKAIQNFTGSASDTSSLFQELLSEMLSDNSLASLAQQSFTNDQSDEAASQAAMPFQTPSFPPVSLLNSKASRNENIDAIVNEAAQQYNVPSKLIQAVIKQESNFNSGAVSQSGASGLMQLMPETANSLGVDDPFDPKQNIFAGTKYLKQMLDKYDGDVKLALAAYNAGPGNVDKFGGIPPFKETIHYVKNITNSFYG